MVNELLNAGLPIRGTRGGSLSAFRNSFYIVSGMNWHLFDTIDIVKYSTGDTVHLSVNPMVNLNLPPMLPNEQLNVERV